MTLKAFHSDPTVKQFFLDRIQQHQADDAIVKGQYWEDGKGCAIGCTYHSNNHMAAEQEAGIPIMLAWLEDSIFEGMPNDQARQWPNKFMEAITVGADLTKVGPKFLLWLIRDYIKSTNLELVSLVEAWVNSGEIDMVSASSFLVTMLEKDYQVSTTEDEFRYQTELHVAQAMSYTLEGFFIRTAAERAAYAIEAAAEAMTLNFEDPDDQFVKFSEKLLELLKAAT